MRLSPAPSQDQNRVLIELVDLLERPTIIGQTKRSWMLIAAARLVARIAAYDRKAFNEAQYHDAAHLIYAPDKPGAL